MFWKINRECCKVLRNFEEIGTGTYVRFLNYKGLFNVLFSPKKVGSGPSKPDPTRSKENARMQGISKVSINTGGSKVKSNTRIVLAAFC